MQAKDFHESRHSEEAPQQFVIETTAAHGKLSHALPYLPSGTLIDGLPAAIMSYCQVGMVAI